MYNHRKLSALAVLLLACFGQINAVQIACSSDSECSNGQGVCTSIGSSSYCSCLSGFGGEDCSVRPDSACDASFGSVSAVSQTLQAESYLHYQYPNLTLSVIANLEESKFAFPDLNDTLNGAPYSEEITVIFGDGSHTECDFPNNNVNWLDLAAAVGNCNDEYALSIAFTDAKSKCGFADNNGDRVFEQVIQINRKYELESLRGAPISRVDTVVKTLRVIFPLEVEVTTSNVQVVGSPSLLAAITLIDFDPSSTPEKWTVQTTTSIQSPFKLSNPQVISVTGSIDADSRFAAGSESLSVVSGCGSNAQDCFQQVSLDFVAGGASDACLGLQGDITIQFNVTCSDGAGAECPLLGAETVQVILTLDTSDACPITEQINFSTSTLSAYSDAAATSPRSAFITNQIAYFGADVQSADAQISARNVKDGSVCFQIVGNACQPVAFNVLTAANGKDPIFSVDFSDSANSAVFAALNAVDATSQLFDVHATIEVDFDGASKSLTKRSVEGTRKVQLSTTVKLSPGSSNSAEAALPNMIILFTFLVFALFF